MADVSATGPSGKVVIRNIGLLLSGDIDRPILDADTIVVQDGLITAVVGTPSAAVDANGLAVGGGGVDSFAFSSSFLSQSGSTAQLTQPRPWSLTDITGTSSVSGATLLAAYRVSRRPHIV